VTKNVLVTGASTGIGRATATYLARRDYTVFAGVRKDADAKALTDELSAIVPVMLDVTDQVQIAGAVETIGDAVGERGLHGLVNNAGVALGGPLEYLPVDVWRTQLEVNVIGQVAVTQAFLPLIRRATGRIVFIGSIGGRVASPMMGPYNASKFALEGISESLRHELAPSGIEVSLIEPGAVKSDIWDKGRSQADDMEQRFPAEALERYREHIAGVRALIEQQDRTGIPGERVARVIERALIDPKPRPRYLVGTDAKVGGALARVLPDRMKERVMRRFG
jgi:NAD(P)-dependent dehydrogenase (short-subunit alcohol dehydrogenase family)